MTGVAAYTLALILLWAGWAKIRRPELAGLAIKNFGLTQGLSRRLGLVLGLFEIALGLAVASRMHDVIVLVLTAAVLWALSAIVARSFVRGDRHDCFCFGATDSPVSLLTLSRTTALAVAATALAVIATGLAPVNAADVNALEMTTAGALLGSTVLLVSVRKLAFKSREGLAFDR